VLEKNQFIGKIKVKVSVEVRVKSFLAANYVVKKLVFSGTKKRFNAFSNKSKE